MTAPTQPLPEPDTTHYAQWVGYMIKYHSIDQIVGYANERVAAALSAQAERHAAEVAELRADAERLDWLEMRVVNVRAPLRYGSRDMFWASTDDIDGGEDEPSDIRAKIDAARAKEWGRT